MSVLEKAMTGTANTTSKKHSSSIVLGVVEREGVRGRGREREREEQDLKVLLVYKNTTSLWFMVSSVID